MVNSSSFELDKELALAFCKRHHSKFKFYSQRDSKVTSEDMSLSKDLPQDLESCSSTSHIRKQQGVNAPPYLSNSSPGNSHDEEIPPKVSYSQPNNIRTIANPSPLGLCAFALTTFVLSLINIQARGVHTNNIVLGLALFYGGLVQLLAGMWEFKTGNSESQ